MNVLVSTKTEMEPSLKKVIDILKSYDIDFDVATPSDAHQYLKKRDFIIALGGDGTVLGTSRLMKMGANSDTPLLSVRGNAGSIGALCYYNLDNISIAINKLVERKYIVEKWTRARATCRNKSICGLNEIYVGSEFSVRASKYNLHFRSKTEYHISSGIVVATGTGITGWFKSILGIYPSQFPHNRDSPDLSYIVRELSNAKKLYPNWEIYPDNYDIIKDGESLCIEWMHDRHGIVASDGSFKSSFPISRGDRVVIENAHDPVKVIKCYP